ncbi:MAG: hypothetical protein C0485_14375 [Pirellula sp.]|nr:hypothetical protein [Pirellula sp.]
MFDEGRMKFGLVLFVAFASAIASPCHGELVQIKYRGTITGVGSAVPIDLSVGDEIIGHVAFSANSPMIHGYPHSEQYPSIRQLSLRTNSGFSASVNAGVIAISDVPRGNDTYSITSRPPVVPDKESGIFELPDGYDPEDPGRPPDSYPNEPYDPMYNVYVPDVASLEQAAVKSQAEGFPGPSGGFRNYEDFGITIDVIGRNMPFDHQRPQLPPKLADVTRGRGVIDFGKWSGYAPHLEATFSVTEMVVVPEPTASASVLVVWFAAILLLKNQWRPTHCLVA